MPSPKVCPLCPLTLPASFCDTGYGVSRPVSEMYFARSCAASLVPFCFAVEMSDSNYQSADTLDHSGDQYINEYAEYSEDPLISSLDGTDIITSSQETLNEGKNLLTGPQSLPTSLLFCRIF